MAFLDDVKTMLDEAGITGGGTGWVCKLGTMPATPDQVVALFESPGRPHEATPGTSPQSDRLTYPNLQVRVRGAEHDYESTRAKLQEVDEFLHAKVSVTPTGSAATFLHILALGSALPLGDDENGRPGVSQNFHTARQE